MEKGRKLITLFATLIFGITLLVAPAPADAKVTVYEDGDAKLQIGFRLQTRLRLLNEAEVTSPTTDTGRDYDFDFRRARMSMGGKINNMVSFFGQYDIGGGTGQAQGGAAANHGTEWRDAFITLKLSDSANLSFGLLTLQFTRSRTSSGFGQMNLDRTFVESTVTNTAGVDGSIGGKRDQQILLWGNAGKINYKLGIGDGAATKDGYKDSLRNTLRVHYAIWDAEKGLGTKETYLGKKKIMTVGFGYDTQPDVAGAAGDAKANTAMTVDFSYENPMDGGGVPNFNAAYYSRDVDDSTSSSEGVGYQASVGYLLPGGTFQPYARYSTWDTDATNSDKTIMNFGFNYMMKGHKAKIVWDWENIDFETDGGTKATDDHSIITMQWQVDF